MNEYDWVIARLPKRDGIDKTCIEDCVRSCLLDGYTKEDALAFTRLTEHANPDLSEEYACKRMNAIAAKYRNPKERIA